MKLIHTEGQEYYGHGEAQCFTCGKPKGKILDRVNEGYDTTALTQAQVDFLIGVAQEHEIKEPSHVVRVYTFARASETRQTGW